MFRSYLKMEQDKKQSIESFETYEEAEQFIQKLLLKQECWVTATLDKGDDHYKVHWKEWTKG